VVEVPLSLLEVPPVVVVALLLRRPRRRRRKKVSLGPLRNLRPCHTAEQ
jgi:hypothetical protein